MGDMDLAAAEARHLFIRTVDDVRARLESLDAYEVLGMSALLRKLLLDEHPLVDQVNRQYRLPLRFEISEVDTPYHRMVMESGPVFWSLQDGLDPNTSLVERARVNVTRDKLLATPVLMVKGVKYSVRDVILYEANVMGGVHAGSPTQVREHALAGVRNIYIGGDTRASLRQLKSIARVILKGIRPLHDAVKRQSS